MLEQVIHSLLLALHNIALVGCAAAPFYNRNLVLSRAQYGPKLNYELDKVVEDTLQGNAPYCIAFISILFATGIGMPVSGYLFNGSLGMNIVAKTALIIKLAFVAGMVAIMFRIFFSINPKLSVMFASFKPGVRPDEAVEKEFFGKRTQRKKLCEICLWFAIGVLVASAFLGFAV